MEIEKKPIENNEVVSVNYTQPKFWHRCMANLVDFVLFVAMFILLFIAARAIVSATPDYKRTGQSIPHGPVRRSMDRVRIYPLQQRRRPSCACQQQ